MKKPIVAAAWVIVLATLLAVAGVMYQQANAAPVQATWQQEVVTIDDEATVAAAQQWGAPFRVEFAATDADVTVARTDAGERVQGHATMETDGDRILGCAIVIDPDLETPALLVHEVGHCLGLGHIATTQRSVLYKWGAADREHGSETVTHVDRAELDALYAR